jgi:NAD(P)-dependent dehydrogenase (short-subunit alcohol dehydrogenase family)
LLMRLEGKVAIVTGGSRGIGFAVAELFSKEGAKVVITSRNSEKLNDAASKLNCTAIKADVRNSDQVKNVINQTVEKFGKIDILINNAGIFPKISKLHEISEDDWNDVLDTNLSGPYRFTKEVIPFLQKNGGVIINVSSDAGLRAYPDFNADAYSASKAALNLLTKTWALQYAKDKIRVNAICPGVVDTDMTTPFLKTEADRKFMNNDHPIGRMGQPEDVARSILFLASDDSSWTTGTIMTVDGGESLK